MSETWDMVVVGGGAAGFFGAVQCAEAAPDAKIAIFEQSSRVLTKVKVSGGGRCNVTHDCYDPDEMARNHYPRGNVELIGPMYRFGVGETVGWFMSRGVELKTESDGRMFPTTDDSQTIIDSLVEAAEENGVEIHTSMPVQALEPDEEGRSYRLELDGGDEILADHVLVATGGIRLSRSENMAEHLEHELVEARPSLFTFDIEDDRIEGLEGISVRPVELEIPAVDLESRGPLLVTHRGLSGPAVLEMSAWGARRLYEHDYQFELHVDWLPGVADVEKRLVEKRKEAGDRQVTTLSPFEELPNRLWARIVEAAGVSEDRQWASLSARGRRAIVEQLKSGVFSVIGKSTHKEEFVTSGGIDTDELDMRTMESRYHPGLYFAGEVVDVDGITGGFNFQAAWTTGFLAGMSVADSVADDE